MRSNDTFALWRAGALVLGCLFFAATGRAQEEGRSPARVVTIKSEPAGTLVMLHGEHRFAGRTPFILPYALSGKYQISTNKPGYESFNTEYSFSSSTKGFLMLKLVQRTAGKAALRSLVLPGWGQLYSERKRAGLMWMGFTLGAAAAFGVNELSYRDAQDEHRAAVSAFRNAPDFNSQQAAWLVAQKALRRVNNAEDDRNLGLYLLGGVWALNLIDSALFFPNRADNAELFRRASLSLSHKRDAAKLNLKISLDKR
jgi:hypothetical protein